MYYNIWKCWSEWVSNESVKGENVNRFNILDSRILRMSTIAGFILVLRHLITIYDNSKIYVSPQWIPGSYIKFPTYFHSDI